MKAEAHGSAISEEIENPFYGSQMHKCGGDGGGD